MVFSVKLLVDTVGFCSCSIYGLNIDEGSSETWLLAERRGTKSRSDDS